MKDLYQLDRKDSNFVAKKLKPETIFGITNIECPNLTYPDVMNILYNLRFLNLKTKDIIVVIDNENGWLRSLELLDRRTDLDCLSDINDICVHYLKGGFAPPWEDNIIDSEKLIDAVTSSMELAALMGSEVSETEKALRLFLWCCRRKPFELGNIRTGYIAANRHLVATGCGVLTMVERMMPPFLNLFDRFAAKGNEGELLEFMYNYCVSGIIY
jgi:hypothetical protein